MQNQKSFNRKNHGTLAKTKSTLPKLLKRDLPLHAFEYTTRNRTLYFIDIEWGGHVECTTKHIVNPHKNNTANNLANEQCLLLIVFPLVSIVHCCSLGKSTPSLLYFLYFIFGSMIQTSIYPVDKCCQFFQASFCRKVDLHRENINQGTKEKSCV